MVARAPVRSTPSTKSSKLWTQRETLVSRSSFAYTQVIVEKAKNATLWDVDGKAYIDFAGGIGTLNVGHCHPKVVEAVKNQADKLFHTSLHVAAYESYFEACRLLLDATPIPGPKKALLLNSGSEAIENAIKMARFHTKRQAVISFDNSFHGRTLLCLSLDGRYKPLRQGFGPHPSAIHHSRFPYPYRSPVPAERLTAFCLEELERTFRAEAAPEDVAAIILEPIQGEGGFIVPSPGFLPALRKLCDAHGIVLIVDEVQTGFGRTGKMFACEHEGVAPDLMTVGKSLAAGLPLSGVVGRAEILDAAPAGSLGGTYGGNPIACAAAVAVFDVFKEEKLLDAARRIGAAVEKRFNAWAQSLPLVGEARGVGAMRAIELVSDKRKKTPLPAAEVKKILASCVDKGLIALKAGAHDNVIRTLMPLTIPEKDLAKGLDILESTLKEHSR